jgi:hypothetical protein
MLAIHDRLAVALNGLAAFQHRAQRLCAGKYGLRVPREQVEEALLLGHQGMKPAHHCSTLESARQLRPSVAEIRKRQ